MQSEICICFLVFSFLLIVPVCWTFSTCIADCNSLLTQCPPSLYEQYCCNIDNSGKTIKLSENNRINIIFCPSNFPISCQRYFTSLNNYSNIFRENASAASGYYVFKGSYGFVLCFYCDLVNYINAQNFCDCYKIFETKSSVLSGYYNVI